jgi:hypothetical protein
MSQNSGDGFGTFVEFDPTAKDTMITQDTGNLVFWFSVLQLKRQPHFAFQSLREKVYGSETWNKHL